ncbi:MAG: response regulator transcription factor [Verrucomicrobiota bacterium]|nr:response regulator transcription factor [Verrucomicrobiota bacterium]
MQKVYLIEDEVLLRDLVIEVIQGHKDLEMVGFSGDGREGLDACIKLKPHIVILDVRLPGLNGVEVATQLKADFPLLKILVFSGVFNLATIRRIMMVKVNAIIEKAAGLTEMEKAIDAVSRGQTYYGPAIVQRMPELLTSPDDQQSLDCLTAREREILQLIAEGLTTKEIADKLGISARTADVHRTHIMQKLGVHNVAGLTRQAVSFGLVSADVSR